MRAKNIFIALALSASAFTAAPALARPAFGIDTAGQLVTFDTSTPGTFTSSRPITGVLGTTIRGIDVRPSNGQLYALAGNTIYRLNTSTGIATAVSTASVGLSGTNFDIDFNPMVDRLRVVSDAGQNLRTNVDTGAVNVDGTLAYGPGDVAAAESPAIVAAGYTNSFLGATTTSLYGIDARNNSLVNISPPNNGTLNTVGKLTLGGMEYDALLGSGFDIFSLSSDSNEAFLSSGNDFFGVDLLTGALTQFGRTAGLLDFTVGTVITSDPVPPIPSAVPEPASWAMMITGMGVAGGSLRRRKKVTTKVAFTA